MQLMRGCSSLHYSCWLDGPNNTSSEHRFLLHWNLLGPTLLMKVPKKHSGVWQQSSTIPEYIYLTFPGSESKPRSRYRPVMTRAEESPQCDHTFCFLIQLRQFKTLKNVPVWCKHNTIWPYHSLVQKIGDTQWFSFTDVHGKTDDSQLCNHRFIDFRCFPQPLDKPSSLCLLQAAMDHRHYLDALWPSKKMRSPVAQPRWAQNEPPWWMDGEWMVNGWLMDG